MACRPGGHRQLPQAGPRDLQLGMGVVHHYLQAVIARLQVSRHVQTPRILHHLPATPLVGRVTAVNRAAQPLFDFLPTAVQQPQVQDIIVADIGERLPIEGQPAGCTGRQAGLQVIPSQAELILHD